MKPYEQNNCWVAKPPRLFNFIWGQYNAKANKKSHTAVATTFLTSFDFPEPQ